MRYLPGLYGLAAFICGQMAVESLERRRYRPRAVPRALGKASTVFVGFVLAAVIIVHVIHLPMITARG